MDLEWHCDISSTSMGPVRSFVAVAGVHLFFHCCSALKGILWSPVFCFWSRVSGSVAVSCALTWRRPAREKNYKKNKRTRYL
jgi:hypothetical protein